ncbi:MAG: YIP1 family protein [Acidobacteriota bacterium]
MDFGSYLQKGIQILQLDRSAIRAVYRDEEALLPAMLFFAVGGLASGVGQFSFRGIIFGVLLMTVVSFVIVGMLQVLARLFGGTATFLELYRPLGIAAPVHWVQVVPFVGAFLGSLAVLYSLAVSATVLETVGGLPRSKALLVVALMFGICLFLGLVFLAVVGSLLLFRSVFS